MKIIMIDESHHDKETWYSGENEDSSRDEDNDEGGESINLVVVIQLVIFLSFYVYLYKRKMITLATIEVSGYSVIDQRVFLI